MSQLKKYDRLLVFGFKVHHSLYRSENRRKAIVILYERSEEIKPEIYKTTISRISKDIGASYQNVKGSIIGDVKGYKKDESLIALEIVAFEKVGPITVYFLTKKGLEVAKVLKELE